ncbi:Uncharacterized protein TCM_022879 [Theobroma cacao]|uniref:Uncharacterized protein n=1 Tax=Theobroma cacao TaxID=3641 RepID=A0A061EUV3_THECC|nr:Uncharacterized protein TCM_022879 [Theobroma cacao]
MEKNIPLIMLSFVEPRIYNKMAKTRTEQENAKALFCVLGSSEASTSALTSTLWFAIGNAKAWFLKCKFCLMIALKFDSMQAVISNPYKAILERIHERYWEAGNQFWTLEVILEIQSWFGSRHQYENVNPRMLKWHCEEMPVEFGPKQRKKIMEHKEKRVRGAVKQRRITDEEVDTYLTALKASIVPKAYAAQSLDDDQMCNLILRP